VSYSQNGWPVDPPRSARTIPGTNVKVVVADGPAGDVLMHVLGRIDREVEDIDLRSVMGEADDWGYANRSIRGSTAVSNHASATAVDINATRHGLGARGTFSPAAVAQIRRILADVDNVVRWGGDYTGRADEMHFEINADYAAVARVAARLSEGDDMAQADVNYIMDKVTRIERMLFAGGSVPGRVADESLVDDVENIERMLYEGGYVKGSVAPGSLFGRVQGIEGALNEVRGMLAELLARG
jgi:hypothetical protein